MNREPAGKGWSAGRLAVAYSLQQRAAGEPFGYEMRAGRVPELATLQPVTIRQLMEEEDEMFGFIVGAAIGAASYWAYQRYVVGSDDDAFADFDTGTIDRPTPNEVHGRPSETVPGYSAPTSGTNPSA